MGTRTRPTQARATARLDSILAGARLHYAAVGRDRFTTSGVAEAAGCSVATVYRYYEDRVDLLDAIAPDRDLGQTALTAFQDLLGAPLSDEERWRALEAAVTALRSENG